jgi:hypothetical protein
MRAFTRNLVLGASALALLTLAACDDAATVPDAAPTAQADGTPGDKAPAPAPIAGKPVDGDSANPAVKPGAAAGDEDRYTLSITPGEGTVGAEGKVQIKVIPKGVWHINLDYPTSLKIEGPEGVKLAKADQNKEDAVALTDVSCEYAVGYTPEQAGEKVFKGKFKFAVCQDEACSPVTEDIEFKVAVK